MEESHQPLKKELPGNWFFGLELTEVKQYVQKEGDEEDESSD